MRSHDFARLLLFFRHGVGLACDSICRLGHFDVNIPDLCGILLLRSILHAHGCLHGIFLHDDDQRVLPSGGRHDAHYPSELHRHCVSIDWRERYRHGGIDERHPDGHSPVLLLRTDNNSHVVCYIRGQRSWVGHDPVRRLGHFDDRIADICWILLLVCGLYADGLFYRVSVDYDDERVLPSGG